MRTAFITQLIEEAKQNNNIFLIVGDLGFHVVEPFIEQFPNRFLNVGIDEQNMIGVAAGLAKEGYNVYVYSIANFPTLRCMEQIRYDVCYHNLNVKIVSVGAGYAYGALGASHHATEEMGMMRTIPNLVVASPSDPIEAKVITTISANYNGPMYLRLGKAGEKIIHTDKVENLQIGDILQIRNGNNNTPALLSCGSILDYAYNFIKDNNIDASIYSVPFIKPINKAQLKEIATNYRSIIVLEEHQKSCGLGSTIIEQINDMYSNNEIETFPKIKRIAINDRFYHIAGDQQFLRKNAGLVLSQQMFDIHN